MYKIMLGEMSLPILPENLKEVFQMDNEKYDIVGLGERVRPGKEKLRTWTISSYFPSDGNISPAKYREYYTELIYKKDHSLPDPIDFDVIQLNDDGTDIIPISAMILFDSIEWEDRFC